MDILNKNITFVGNSYILSDVTIYEIIISI